jgi:adenosylcobinamide kinase/adenosylcobinamide-phosphate guanylyltransferase
MFLFVIGGTASGKSEYAEKCAAELAAGQTVIYAATMQDTGGDSQMRIARHIEKRSWYSSETFECFSLDALKALTEISYGRTVIFDCLSGFVADVMFGEPPGTSDEISDGLLKLSRSCKNLVVVSDMVFSDGCTYDAETLKYIDVLGRVCIQTASHADRITEVVCGIPVEVTV